MAACRPVSAKVWGSIPGCAIKIVKGKTWLSIREAVYLWSRIVEAKEIHKQINTQCKYFKHL